jgi:hypothetical protein
MTNSAERPATRAAKAGTASSTAVELIRILVRRRAAPKGAPAFLHPATAIAPDAWLWCLIPDSILRVHAGPIFFHTPCPSNAHFSFRY